MTYQEFEKKYLGKAIDFDNTAGVQCVDLVDLYLKECFGITGVWVTGARELYNRFNDFPDLVKRFDRVPNTRSLVIKPGDIVVWGGGDWGHTGIGTGKGDIDKFECIEENTKGMHEPTQKVTHLFASGSCNPVLGVLRPKSGKVLDTSGFALGDKGLGVYFLKRYLISVFGLGMDDNDKFGAGTEKAVNELLKSKGYTENGIAGANFAKTFIK